MKRVLSYEVLLNLQFLKIYSLAFILVNPMS